MLTNGIGLDDRYLLFTIEEQLLGVEISRVREIIEYTPVTKVPLSPLYVHGVLNLRGNVVPVIDMLALMELRPAAITRRTCIVIIDFMTADQSVVAGVLADHVREVATMPAEQVDTSSSLRSRFRADLVQGIGRAGDRFVVLLNPEMLLHLAEIFSAHDLEEHAESPLLAIGQ